MIRPNIILCCLFLLAAACKKDKKTENNNTPDPGPLSLRRAYFEDTLLRSPVMNGDLFATIASPQGAECAYLLQKIKGTSYFLVRCDLEANVTYTRHIELDGNKLIDLGGSKNTGDFYTLTAPDFPKSLSGQVINAYVYKGGYADSVSCDQEMNANNYEFDPEYQISLPSNSTSFSQLKKFNDKGDEVWNKILEGSYFRGNAIETDEQGNVYVLTALQPEPSSRLVIEFSGSIPYYSFNRYENSIILHKFSSDGTLLFKHPVNYVLEELPGNFSPSLALSKNAVYVRSLNNLFTFNQHGMLLSSVKPVKDVCYNRITHLVANQKAEEARMNGVIVYTPSSQNKYSLKLNAITASAIANTSTILMLIAMDPAQNCYAGGGNSLIKLSATGSEIYNVNLTNSSGFFTAHAGDHNCIIDRNNDFYSFTPELDLLKIYKFNKEGKFN